MLVNGEVPVKCEPGARTLRGWGGGGGGVDRGAVSLTLTHFEKKKKTVRRRWGCCTTCRFLGFPLEARGEEEGDRQVDVPLTRCAVSVAGSRLFCDCAIREETNRGLLQHLDVSYRLEAPHTWRPSKAILHGTCMA